MYVCVRPNEHTLLTPGVTSEWVGWINKHSKNQHLEERSYIRHGILKPVSLTLLRMWLKTLIMTPIYINYVPGICFAFSKLVI